MAWELASAQLEAKQKLWASGSVDCALKLRRQKTVMCLLWGHAKQARAAGYLMPLSASCFLASSLFSRCEKFMVRSTSGALVN
jgi:hypothetical protein